MLIGYARISKADGSQSLDLQRDALRQSGVSDDAIYEDQASGQREDRPAGRRDRRLEARSPRSQSPPSRQPGARPQRQGHRDPGARRPRGQHRHDLGQRKVGLRALRGFGGIRTRADPGTDPRWIGLCTQTRQRHPSSPSTAYPLRGSRTGSWGWFDLGPAILNPFLVTDTSDFVGSVRCTAPEGGLFTGVAVELDAGNRIFTTLPVVPVEERTDRE